MKKKITAGLIAIVVIASVAIFTGCVEKDEITPSTPMPSEPSITEDLDDKNATSEENKETPAPTSSPLFKKKPEPYFPSKSYGEGYNYAPGGIITGVTIEGEVRNRGGPGEVFVTVAGVERKDLRASEVFYMDEDESVMVRAHFRVFTSGPFICKFECTARAASPDDTSQGEIQLVRSNMKQVGHLAIGGATDIAVLGDYAYVVIEESWPFDYTPYDPANPFMADADISLKVIDVSNPYKPKEVGRYDFNPAHSAFAKYGVCVKDQYAYVAIGYHNECDDNGLHIFDVSDPSHPLKIGQYYTEGGACDVAVAENYAYVPTREATIELEPHFVDSVGERSLLIFDISTPSNPRNVGQLELSVAAESIAVKDNDAYIVSHGRLWVIDISLPNSPREVVTQDYMTGVTGTGKNGVAVSNSFAYLTTHDSSLFVFDIGIPSNPTAIGKYSPEGDYGAGYGVSVSGNYAYIAYTEGLLVIDISNPSTPVQVGHYTGGGRCVAVSGNYVYLGGLHIIESYR